MFIQTQDTPNPAALKFLPGCAVMGEAPPQDFPNPQSAVASPLAQNLFAIEGIVGVFFGQDFIAVTKDEAHEWQHIKPSILSAIMEHFVAARPIMADVSAAAPPDNDESANENNDEDDEITKAIKHILDTRVRPAVAQDGGDVVFHGFHDGVVSLHLRGACAGCPSATQTLKGGIENLLKHYVPQVSEVRAVL
ncbi:MAG: NifU family protein [Alphaproteobacteria bacterium]|nr:NifU family protein [Alphaproteobacteria bacterium]MBE8220848.1 NifU family protein [Alphaproteobacteria bacterium]